jgi:hypothetical protein
MKKLLMVTAALCAIPASAFADEALKVRSVYHVTSVQSQDVGDIDAHTMSLVRASGLASFSDGAVATDNFTTTTDYVKGSGPFLLHGIITFSDGSALAAWRRNFRKGLPVARAEVPMDDYFRTTPSTLRPPGPCVCHTPVFMHWAYAALH